MSAKKKGASKAATGTSASGVAKDEAKATASLFGSDGNRDEYLALVAELLEQRTGSVVLDEHHGDGVAQRAAVESDRFVG